MKTTKLGRGIKIKIIENESPHVYRYFPNIIRSCIVGPSNCGKTNLLISILTDSSNPLYYNNIYIYSKSLDQPAYRYLEEFICGINEYSKRIIGLYKFTDSDKVLPVEEAEPFSIIIFDDVATHNQTVMQEYYSRARHKNISCFYLCQTYSKIQKQMVRDNFNLLIIFKIDDLNLKHIYENHVGTDMSIEIFKTLCNESWKNKHDFIVINKEKPVNEGKYSRNFNYVYTHI